MSTAALAKRLLRFGSFELNLATGELRKCGIPIKLRPQSAKVLVLLASKPGEAVTREQLRNEVWGEGFFVDFEHALNVCIGQIRAALDDDAEKPRYIETIPRVGYRFIARVEEIADDSRAISQPVRAMDVAAAEPGREILPREIAGSRPRQRWAVGALAVALIAAMVFFAIRARLPRKPQPVHIQSLAVLPLENLSRDPDQEYFVDGMTDELITDLAKIHTLRIISRNSVMQYKGKHKPVPQIARELNVDAVVEGTVMRSGDRVRITAQLIAAPQDRHLWAETYEGDLRNVLSLQDEVTTAIAKQISIELSPEEQTRFAHARSVDPEAHQAYLRGLYELRNRTVENNAKAIEHFQRAIAIDPNDPFAYEGLALVYSTWRDSDPRMFMPKARAAALKAIELDDSLAEAHSTLGLVKLVFDWDWAGGEQELRKALELNPNSPLAHEQYATYLLLVPHRVDEAIQNAQRGYELDPAEPQVGDPVEFFFYARRYQAAINEAAKELEENSPFLALAYAEMGRRDEALAVAQRAAASARVPSQVAQTASAYALAGDKEKARALLRQLIAQAKGRYLCGKNVAAVYSVLGDKDDAMVWLEKAYRDRST